MTIQTIIRRHLCSITICGAFLSTPPPLCSAAERPQIGAGTLSAGLGFEYATGRFGTDIRTDFISVPLTIDYRPTEKWDFELVVPYIWQSNGNTVYGAIMPLRNQTGVLGPQAAAKRFGAGPAGSSGGASGGLGDVTLSGGYELLTEGDTAPQVRMTAYLKFPTADRDRGLGTGEFDAGPGLAFDKWFDAVNLFAEGSYIFQGESDIYATRDYLSYSAGIGRQFTDSLYLSLSGKGATAPADDAPGLFEGRISFNWDFLAKTGLEGYLSRGLTNGTPEYGVSMSLFRHF